MPIENRQVMFDDENNDWYLPASMLGLSPPMQLAIMFDGQAIQMQSQDADKPVFLYSTKHILAEKIGPSSMRQQLRQFIKNLSIKKKNRQL